MSTLMVEDDGAPVIVGSGLAGLVVALSLAPRPVVVVTKDEPAFDAASAWAQGGIAAAVGADDSPARHAADTIDAGAGLSDPGVAASITAAGPDAVAWLERQGVRFARAPSGAYKAKLEAVHSARRVLNASGDGTGAEIMRALVAAARATPSIRWLTGVTARTLITDAHGVAGVAGLSRDGEVVRLASRAVVLATGGCGGLWAETTNPIGARGQGLALAARAGAQLVDLEFVQFHPTALAVGLDPMPLVSEAVRGDGAGLIDEAGRDIMAGFARGALEPRDVVARAVFAALSLGHQVFLDTRASLGAGLAERFPKLAAACAAAGLDPVADPIPIRPAAHYHMGGIAVDEHGRTSLPGLWACGEVAATGLHGANRLASNSLLEAVVCGRRLADDLVGLAPGPMPSACHAPAIPQAVPHDAGRVRRIMSRHVGVIRDAAGLATALGLLHPWACEGDDAALVALMITAAALGRTESRGGHFRADFPAASPEQAVRRAITLDAAMALAAPACQEAAE